MQRTSLIFAVLFAVAPLLGQAEAYVLGRARMLEGDYPAARQELQKALDEKPGDVRITYQLGLCLFESKDYQGALELFSIVDKQKKGMGSFYLAKIEFRLNRTELALKYLREHLDSRYKMPEKDILLDPDLGQLENHPGWQQLWNEKEWYSEKDQLFQEALFLAGNGHELEALNLLNQLEKRAYKRSLVLEHKARIYARLGNEKAAAKALQAAVKSDARNLDALQLLCEQQVVDGDFDDASQGLNRLLRQEPDRFEAYLLRAKVRSELDMLGLALDDLDLYLEVFPESHEGWNARGMVQYQHRKYLNALQSFHRAIALDQSSAAYYLNRGRTFMATGTLRSASSDLSMSLDLDPYNGQSWYAMGLVKRELGQLKDACPCFEKAYQYGVYEAGELIERECQ